MSGAAALRAAIHAALTTHGPLLVAVNQIADGVPVKASPPWVGVGEANATAWGGIGVEGHVVRVPVVLSVSRDSAETIGDISPIIEAAVANVPDHLGDWRVIDLRLVRTRISSLRSGDWTATMEWAARIARIL